MLNFFKKPKFPTTIFIIASFLVLFFFISFYMIVRTAYYDRMLASSNAQDKYFTKDYQGDSGDPLITKNPNLKDILAGPIISYRDPSLGDEKSPITIVEYSDFQCDYCIEQEKTLREITAKYQGKVRLIWKDYPEPNVNTASYQAAKAARCAQQQGLFWPYHDLLFANNDSITKNLLYEIAKKASLDTDSFDTCYQSNMVENLINDNISEADILDINGIPFLYVNDQEVMGNISSADLERMIKLELSKQTQAAPGSKNY